MCVESFLLVIRCWAGKPRGKVLALIGVVEWPGLILPAGAVVDGAPVEMIALFVGGNKVGRKIGAYKKVKTICALPDVEFAVWRALANLQCVGLDPGTEDKLNGFV